MTYNNLRYPVVNRLDLGRTRIAGYTLFNPKNCSFQETPPSLTKQLVEMGQVNGLIIENDEIALDPDFCQYNLIIKSGVGNYRLLNENRDQPEDLMLSVTKAITDPETHENVYEVVTNKCARVCIHEWALMDYVQKGMVAGCECIEDEKGEKHLIFCVGVDLDDYHPEEAIKSVRPNEDDTSTGKDDHDSEEGEVNPDAEQGTENPIWDEPAKDGLEALFGSDDQPEGQTEGESAEKKPVEPENKDSGKENKASKRKSKK